MLNLFERARALQPAGEYRAAGGFARAGPEIQAPPAPETAQRHQSLAEAARFRPLPPLPGQSPDAWQNTGEALAAPRPRPHPALVALAMAGASYAGRRSPTPSTGAWPNCKGSPAASGPRPCATPTARTCSTGSSPSTWAW